MLESVTVGMSPAGCAGLMRYRRVFPIDGQHDVSRYHRSSGVAGDLYYAPKKKGMNATGQAKEFAEGLPLDIIIRMPNITRMMNTGRTGHVDRQRILRADAPLDS